VTPTKTPLGGAKPALALEGQEPTITPTEVHQPSGLTILKAKAVPNISTNGAAIQFEINLEGQARIELSLYTITGELVYRTEASESTGIQRIPWTLQNQSGNQVASGIYIYLLQVSKGEEVLKKTGKVLVIH